MSSSSLKVASLTQSFSYFSLDSLVLGTANVASTGSSSIVIAAGGLGFVGMSGTSRVDGSACENSRWLAESSIACKVFEVLQHHPV